MSKRYVIQGYPGDASPLILTAGSQGLTVVGCTVTSAGSSGAGVVIQPATSIVGGDAVPITPLREQDPAALSTAVQDPTSVDMGARLGYWQLEGPLPEPVDVCRDYPIQIAPGSSLGFSGTSDDGSVLNVYIEE